MVAMDEWTPDSMYDRNRTASSRRRFLQAAVGLAAGAALPLAVTVRPAGATPETMQEAIRKTVGAATVNPGKVRLDLPPLVENGNSVGMAVRVESPMTASDHVKAVHVFSEKNPQPYVISAYFGPRSGRAVVSTRIRLADTQTIIAIAEMSDGSFWAESANVVVTLAACLEELS
jgi:sulfur-oxidizing protein SoxY